MENYGSEIGQKMRSAVKAKLLELGTGGSSGYIDDELPDYVMIMVANKRSKQQMISDLNLFLGSQTELFVTWLHEVLQKLQEVTLPAVSASSSKKRKSTQKDEPSGSITTKKDKKPVKKEKIPAKKSKDVASTSPEKSAPKSSSTIREMFAEELLEKAKQDIDTTVEMSKNIKKSKNKPTGAESDDNSPDGENETQDFDIPTMSEISSTTEAGTSEKPAIAPVETSGNREKDLAELAEIQKKIYAAKKQLKQIGEFEDDDEYDEDFITLRDDESRETFSESRGKSPQSTPPVQQTAGKKPKSPIVFDYKDTAKTKSDDDNALNNDRKRFTDDDDNALNNNRKRFSGDDNALNNNRKRFTEDDNTHNNNRKRFTDDDNALNNNRKRFTDEDNALNNNRKRFTPPLAPVPSDNQGKSSSRDEAPERPERPKRPVHERLGLKPLNAELPKPSQHVSRERRRNLQEKELYVPAFRRKEMEREVQDQSREKERGSTREKGRDKEKELDRRLDRSRENDGNNISRGRSRVRRSIEDREKRRMSSDHIPEARSGSQVGKISTTTVSSSSPDYSPDRNLSRKRVGSRVIVAPVKVLIPSDEEDISEKPVNSIIKIKPRTPVSPSKQAPKNLLLRAVAEAQKSTFLKSGSITAKPKVSSRLGDKVLPERSTKLFTKSFRDRRKTTGGVGAIFTRTTQNLIVEVNGRAKERFTTRQEVADNDEEYIPEIVSDRGESDPDLVYVPQTIKSRAMQNDHDEDNWSNASGDSCYEHIDLVEGDENIAAEHNTQFVVTLNDEKDFPKLKRIGGKNFSGSLSPASPSSPPPQVSSSSSYCKEREKIVEATSTSNSTMARRKNMKDRKSKKEIVIDPESSPILLEERTLTPRSELIETYRKPKEVKKIIIQNDSEDEEMSPTKKHSPEKERRLKRAIHDNKEHDSKSTTPPPKVSRQQESLPPTPSKRKHAPIKFDLEDKKDRKSPVPVKRRRSSSKEKEKDSNVINERNSREREREMSHERREEKRKISIRNSEIKKYDNIPSTLSSVPLDSSAYRGINKPKERCKYHPNCTKTFCEFYHPTATCKSFPNCKYADKCLYSHPKCKYDTTCVNLDCNFSHSGSRNASLLEPTAPPLSSSVVPVQNYKSISSTAITGPVSATTCKFFPNCTKTSCPFYHPKPCRYGKNCINKLECLFYHHEVLSSSKFKWVASVN